MLLALCNRRVDRGRVGVRQHLINQHLREARPDGIGRPGRTTQRPTGTPIRLAVPAIQRGILIPDDQRETEPIGDRIPVILIIEIEDRARSAVHAA